MSRTSHPILIIPCLLLFTGMAQTAQGAGQSALCYDAIDQAARTSGVPKDILLAVALTESGRQGASGPEPWPWALNQGGEGKWFTSQVSALEWLNAVLAQGVTNIDIGCFQLNWRWHGDAFPSTAAMIDPIRNADYAAEFLTRLKQQTGSWEQAVAGYHSFTPDLAARYMERFRPILASLQGDMTDFAAPGPEAERVNSYPLLQQGDARSAGSLVTVSGSLRPLFGRN